MSRNDSPLILPADIFPDMSAEEIAREIENMFVRSQAIYDAISGIITPQNMIELVEFSGVDIAEWALDCDRVSGNW
jgi:hypothetical protein